VVKPKHDARYWARRTRSFDFSDADRVPPGKFNLVVWRGLMGQKPYPVRLSRRAMTERDERDDD
jgi:hypothetical protein